MTSLTLYMSYLQVTTVTVG